MFPPKQQMKQVKCALFSAFDFLSLSLLFIIYTQNNLVCEKS